jgi:hypothetical protein
MPEVPLESGSIVNGGAFIGCVILRAWDKRIGGAKSIRAVGPISTIDTDPSFPFSDCPLDWVKNQANNKVKKNPGEMNMEGFLLFFRKLCFHVREMFSDRWMVVIVITSG